MLHQVDLVLESCNIASFYCFRRNGCLKNDVPVKIDDGMHEL